MLRIFTQDYTELDLAPDYGLLFELGNPMFDEAHIATAFSTQIPFPPSPTNRRTFGYIPAMMLPPSVTSLAATVWIGGVPFLAGTLVYDGLEEGNLLYTFTQKVPALENKIWDQSLLAFSTGRLPEGGGNIFKAPLVVRGDNVTLQPYLRGPADDNLWVKFWNYRLSSAGVGYGYQDFLPAVPVAAILKGLPVTVPPDMAWLLEDVCILGRFHEYLSEDISLSSRRVSGEEPSAVPGHRPLRRVTSSGGTRVDGNRQTDIASMLPDVKFSDFLKNLGSIFCGSFFQDGAGLHFVTHSSVLESPEVPDWSDKVSDRYSCDSRPGTSYKFGYADDSDSYDPGQMAGRSGVTKVTAGGNGDFNPAIILQAFGTSGEYGTVLDRTTGDIYSGRSYKICHDIPKPGGYTSPHAYDCDVIYHNAKPVSVDVDDEDAETFDNSSSFHLVRCIPEKIFPDNAAGTFPTESEAKYRMVPVVPPNAVADGRDSKVYIGIIDNSLAQMTDHDQFCAVGALERSRLGKLAMTPTVLWEQYHEPFAGWLSRRRQQVSAELRLSPLDFHGFRFYRPVYFKGRRWLVKTLRVEITTGGGSYVATGDFVEI